MSKKHKRRVKNGLPLTKKIALWQIGVLVGVLALIGSVLWLKSRPANSEAAPVNQPTLVTPSDDGVTEATQLPKIPPSATEAPGDSIQTDLAPREGELPEVHLERMLAEGQLTFAFFHSDTCYQCVETDKVVHQVYPDFAGQVALVDVNVHDEANQALLQRAGIRVIPTLVFIDRTGDEQVHTGMMDEAQIRTLLTALAEGAPQ